MDRGGIMTKARPMSTTSTTDREAAGFGPRLFVSRLFVSRLFVSRLFVSRLFVSTKGPAPPGR